MCFVRLRTQTLFYVPYTVRAHVCPVLSNLDSEVDITTGYRLEGLGIEFRWGRDLPHLSKLALGPPSPLYNEYRVFPGSKKRLGLDADPSPP
jgi:hypothetical protein